MVETIVTKQCRTCKKIRPISDFHISPVNSDGHCTQCKDCKNSAGRIHYRTMDETAKKERMLQICTYRRTGRGRIVSRNAARKYAQSHQGRAVTKAFWRSEKGKRCHREADKKYKALNPLARKAKQFLNDAVSAGTIPRIGTQKCMRCGSQAHHYHHEDYNRPYDVVPLCRMCHGTTRIRD